MDSHQAEQTNRIKFNSKEIEELGIEHHEAPPEPKQCKFCGKTLYHEALVYKNKVMVWNRTLPERCNCEKAQEYWNEYDKHAEERKAKAREKLDAQERQERFNQLLNFSGIKKRFLNRTFESFKTNIVNKKAFDKAVEYVTSFKKYQQDGRGLYFEGTNGTGKTHLAVAIGLALMKQNVPVICKTSIDILDDIKATYNNDSGTSTVLSVYKKVDVLIIDDLGKEQTTEWSVPLLFSIINERYEEMRPTIITTNYNEEMLINKMVLRGGDKSNITAIISRLRETTDVITMAWEDYRSK